MINNKTFSTPAEAASWLDGQTAEVDGWKYTLSAWVDSENGQRVCVKVFEGDGEYVSPNSPLGTNTVDYVINLAVSDGEVANLDCTNLVWVGADSTVNEAYYELKR